MVFRVQMKDPDTLGDSIREAVTETADAMATDLGLTAKEAEAVNVIRVNSISDLCSKWFRYGEYLTVEIDTEANTCVVIPAGG